MNQVALNSSFQEVRASVIALAPTTVAEALAQVRLALGPQISDLAKAAGCSSRQIENFSCNYNLLSDDAYDQLQSIEVCYALPFGTLTNLVPGSVRYILRDLPQDLHGAFVAVVKNTGLLRPDLASQLEMPPHQLRHWVKVGGFRSVETPRILSTLELYAELAPGVLTSRFETQIASDRIEERLPADFWPAIEVLCEASGYSVGDIEAATGSGNSTIRVHHKGNTLPLRARDFAEKLERLFLLRPGTLQMRIPDPSALSRSEDWQVAAPTITSLITFGQSIREKAGKKPATVQTDISTLWRFLDYHGVTDEVSVSPLLDAGFPEALDRFLITRQESGANEKSLSSDRARLEEWHRNVREFLTSADLPDDFRKALKLAIDRSGHSFDEFARLTGIREATIRSWYHGVYPSLRSVDHITNMEAALELPLGALTSKLGRIRKVAYGTRSIKPREIERHRISLKTYALTALPPRVEEQWQALFEFKTSSGYYRRPRPTSHPCVSDFKNRRRPSRWSIRKTGLCETAEIYLATIKQFLGFLTLSPDHTDIHLRGLGHTLESLSLADLIDLNNVSAYVQFRRSRCGLGQEMLRLLQFAQSLIHPTWGIFRLRHELFHSGDPELWRDHCDDAFEALKDFENDLIDDKEIRKLRDPKVELAYILDRPSPMDVLVELETKMRADRPSPTWSDETKAVYWRNLTLICLLISNPLRISNFAYMTYRPEDEENPGHLRKIGKEWHFHIPPDQFKNEEGAASEPYIVEIPDRLWPLLDDYTTKWRPILLGEKTSDRLFLPSTVRRPGGERVDPTKGASLCEISMSNIVTKLTRAYIAECPGFGPHAFRHIIVTDYLKANPNGHVAAAAILHDTIATVLRDYAHLKVADSYQFYKKHYNARFGASRHT